LVAASSLAALIITGKAIGSASSQTANTSHSINVINNYRLRCKNSDTRSCLLRKMAALLTTSQTEVPFLTINVCFGSSMNDAPKHLFP
jgi:hypothetical protein